MALTHEYGLAPTGYRLPDATRLGRVVLQVADLTRSVDYYATVVGLAVLGQHGSVVRLGPAGAPEDETLLELRERPGARAVPRRGRLGLFHVAFLLPNRPALARVLRHLGELGVEPGMSDHFVSEALYLWDPDGLGLEIYADRPRSIWRAEGRQLYMTSEALDVEGLLAEATDESPAFPRGAAVGHVHLSVDDLTQASRFYHEAVGFDRIVWSYPGALFLSAGGYHHHLGTNTWATGAPVATDEDARLVEWEIVLPTAGDVDAAHAHAGAKGWAAPAGLLADPWGVGVRIRTAAARASAPDGARR
jgi:catechol 2,3-dioxygenase